MFIYRWKEITEPGRDYTVFWWALTGGTVVVLLFLLGLFLWISSDPGVEKELASNRLRAEQEYRALRREGKLTAR
jgi:hypothetical protein